MENTSKRYQNVKIYVTARGFSSIRRFRISCRTVALRKKKMLTDRRATVPPIVKTVYLLLLKKPARFNLHFFHIFTLSGENPRWKTTRLIYLFGTSINGPLVHFNYPLSAWNSSFRIYLRLVVNEISSIRIYNKGAQFAPMIISIARP